MERMHKALLGIAWKGVILKLYGSRHDQALSEADGFPHWGCFSLFSVAVENT
jgi:hypothetical protein